MRSWRRRLSTQPVEIRKLIATASLNLAHRWYLGYALDEALPDHSSLTRIRQRLGVDIFQCFFERIVDLCQEAGLVWGRELYFDATKVEANAWLDSLVPRFAYQAKAHVDDLFADELTVAKATPEPASADPPAGIVWLPIASDARPRSLHRIFDARDGNGALPTTISVGGRTSRRGGR